MLRRVPIALALIVATALTAAAQSQDELKKMRDEKLAGAWLKKNDWTTDYEVAQERAAKTGKPIFAYFTRSYRP